MPGSHLPLLKLRVFIYWSLPFLDYMWGPRKMIHGNHLVKIVTSKFCLLLKQWSSKCGPWASSSNMTWELVRNILTSDLWIRVAGDEGQGRCVSTSPPGDSHAHQSLRSMALKIDGSIIWCLLGFCTSWVAVSKIQLIFSKADPR